MPAIEPLPRNNPASSGNHAVKRSKGTGGACSFTPLPYPRPYETEVISVKKLLLFVPLPVIPDGRLSSFGVKMGHSRWVAPKLLRLNSIGDVHVK